MRVIVIGAGLIGVATAYFLNQQGHAVEVLDRREGAGMDTSFANGGMLTPSQSEPWNQPGIFWKALAWVGRADSPFLVRPRALLGMAGWGWNFLRNSSPRNFLNNMRKNARLATYSLGILRELRRRHDLHYHESTRGTIKVFTDGKTFDAMIEHAGLYADLNIAHRLLDGPAVIGLEPSLSAWNPPIIGGIHYPDDESGDAHVFCQLVAQQALQAGVNFHYQVEVTGFERVHRRITAVRTALGSRTADVYVLAAGSYSTLLAKSVDINLPVRPVKGYSLTIDLDDLDRAPRIPVVDESMHIAYVPLGARLRVAGTAEINGYDPTIRRERIASMYRHVARVYPELAAKHGLDSIKQWAGLRPYSSDGVPVMGQTPYDNLYLNTGHGHLGWSMAAGSGKFVADIVSGMTPALDPKPYALDRLSG